jgi:hypothetical protein
MQAKTESDAALPAVIRIDIGKEVFHLVGLGAGGKIAFPRKIRRLGLNDAVERLPPCIVSMEACLSAHFVSRTLRTLGPSSYWCWSIERCCRAATGICRSIASTSTISVRISV